MVNSKSNEILTNEKIKINHFTTTCVYLIATSFPVPCCTSPVVPKLPLKTLTQMEQGRFTDLTETSQDFIGQPSTNVAHLDDQARACFLCWLAPSQRGFHSNFRRCETLRFNSVLSMGRGCDCRADTHKRAIRVGWSEARCLRASRSRHRWV